MSLPPEFVAFHESWTAKVAEYTDPTARSHFDRFLTQYVIYNRLYCEATMYLSRQAGSGIQLEGRDSFPDGTAAKVYVVQYLGARHLIDALNHDTECVAAINELRRILSEHQFFIKLHPVTGDRQVGQDDELLARINTTDRAVKAGSILEFIYHVRCNMMHGQKGFSEEQVALLQPTTILLQKVCSLLYAKLTRNDD